MMFTAEDRWRVTAGQISVSWRLWKYAHVKAGGIYSTGFGFVEIEDLHPVLASEITDQDAREAGFSSAQALIAFAASHTRATVSPQTTLYRVAFRYLGERDRRPTRPPLDLDTLAKRLARLDENSPRGPWTLDVLRLIEANPQLVARELADQLDWGTLDFKAHVRKLKALGLTISCPVGYELSELGQNYLDSRDGSQLDGDYDDEEMRESSGL